MQDGTKVDRHTMFNRNGRFKLLSCYPVYKGKKQYFGILFSKHAYCPENKMFQSSVSQPPARGPVPGPGINYTGPREAWGNYNMLQDFISPVTDN